MALAIIKITTSDYSPPMRSDVHSFYLSYSVGCVVFVLFDFHFHNVNYFFCIWDMSFVCLQQIIPMGCEFIWTIAISSFDNSISAPLKTLAKKISTTRENLKFQNDCDTT